MKAVVFAGPSLAKKWRVDDDELVFAPPIKRGDLELFQGFDPVIIVDGEFGQNLSVSPKEILGAIRDGRRIIGASSMGALRASELDGFGMVGVGWIYNRFASAAVRYDDDVALGYSPEDFTPLTVPLVNVLYSVESAAADGLISKKESQNISKQARGIFYADRDLVSVTKIFESVIGIARYEHLQGRWDGPLYDIKEADAIAAIALGRDILRGSIQLADGG